MTIVILSTELIETPASASLIHCYTPQRITEWIYIQRYTCIYIHKQLIHFELERAYNQTTVIEVGELPQ